ncbi:MAG: phosphoglycerate dehydrogenase, partial [Bacteroidetes bacterium QS_8_64_10]
MPKKVLISDRVDPVCTDLLEEHGYTPNVQLGKSNDELKEHVASAAAWIVRSGTTVTDEMMEAAADLQVIGRAGVGVDNIDTDAATRRGLLVINAPDGNTISTAEHACAMTMALMREIPQAHSSLAGGKWERKSFMGAEVYGKTLGVVGVGKIGREVARRMASFEMDVLGHDPVLSEEMAERLGVELVSFDELCGRSDVITVHTPLNDSTRGLIDGSRLNQCKPGVRIVNCARGGIVDEEDLLEALANEQVIRALEDRPVSTPVNGMAIRMAGEPEVQPYLRLADRLGQVAGQLEDGPLERATVRCHGETPHRYADVLAIAALKGVLSRWVDAPVNMINAPVLADEHGVRLEEQRGSATGGGLANQIEVVLNGADGNDEQRLVAGTLFAGDDPRLVRVDDYDGLEVRPEGRLLVYRNEDRPGMLASVGKILAEAGINIGALALGRRE